MMGGPRTLVEADFCRRSRETDTRLCEIRAAAFCTSSRVEGSRTKEGKELDRSDRIERDRVL